MNILEEANTIINGDREQTYGSPDKNLLLIATYWEAHINSKYNVNITLTVDDVCVMMILLKQARLANTPNHHDSMVDTVGYMALMDKCQKLASKPEGTIPGTAIDGDTVIARDTLVPLGKYIPCTTAEYHRWNTLPSDSALRLSSGGLIIKK